MWVKNLKNLSLEYRPNIDNSDLSFLTQMKSLKSLTLVLGDSLDNGNIQFLNRTIMKGLISQASSSKGIFDKLEKLYIKIHKSLKYNNLIPFIKQCKNLVQLKLEYKPNHSNELTFLEEFKKLKSVKLIKYA